MIHTQTCSRQELLQPSSKKHHPFRFIQVGAVTYYATINVPRVISQEGVTPRKQFSSSLMTRSELGWILSSLHSPSIYTIKMNTHIHVDKECSCTKLLSMCDEVLNTRVQTGAATFMIFESLHSKESLQKANRRHWVDTNIWSIPDIRLAAKAAKCK